MDADALLNLIASRRSSVLIDQSRDVDPLIIEQMISAAQWAPNHKRTWPARFCVVSGESRGILGHAIADAMAARGDDEAKVLKTRTKYARSPYVLIVASANGASGSETEENRYAVAAGIQNMLLVAHTHGLATLWGSPAKGAHEAINAFAGFDETDHVLGLIYVGWPLQEVPTVERPAPVVTERS
jgi:nitroreductase